MLSGFLPLRMVAVARQGVQPFALLAPASQVLGFSSFAHGGRCALGCSTLRAPGYGVSGSFGFPPLRKVSVACQDILPFALLALASNLLLLGRQSTFVLDLWTG